MSVAHFNKEYSGGMRIKNGLVEYEERVLGTSIL